MCSTEKFNNNNNLRNVLVKIVYVKILQLHTFKNMFSILRFTVIEHKKL
jgi:hypothetical protein